MRFVERMRYTAFLFLLLSALDLFTPSLAAEKDLRTRTDADGETEISFCSRPSPNAFGFPGHAFVVFSELSRGAPRKFRAVGHTMRPTASTAAAAFTYFGGSAVAGQQAEERFTHMKQACLTLKVDRIVYERALAAARPTLVILGIPDQVAGSLERYSLNENDCVDFAIKVAQQLRTAGLSVPNRNSVETPAQYISKLVAANR